MYFSYNAVARTFICEPIAGFYYLFFPPYFSSKSCRKLKKYLQSVWVSFLLLFCYYVDHHLMDHRQSTNHRWVKPWRIKILFSDCFHYSCVLRTCSFYLFILYTIPSSFQLLSHCALGIFYMLTNLTSKVISFEEFAVYLLIRSPCESNPESNFYFIIFFLMKTSWPLQFHHLLHPQLLWGVFKSPSVLQEQSAVQVFISFTCFYVNK